MHLQVNKTGDYRFWTGKRHDLVMTSKWPGYTAGRLCWTRTFEHFEVIQRQDTTWHKIEEGRRPIAVLQKNGKAARRGCRRGTAEHNHIPEPRGISMP